MFNWVLNTPLLFFIQFVQKWGFKPLQPGVAFLFSGGIEKRHWAVMG